MDGHWASSLVDIVTEQLVEHITALTGEELGRLLLFALLDDLVLEPLDLLLADVELGLNLRQIVLSGLHQVVELVNMFDQDIFLVLQVPDVVRVALAVLVKVVDLLVEVK